MIRKAFLAIALFALSGPLLAQEVVLRSVSWTIDPACPGLAEDDLVEVSFAYSGFTPETVIYVERSRQTTETSCSRFVEVYSLAGFQQTSGTLGFVVPETTSLDKAFLWRVIVTVNGSPGTVRFHDFLIQPPGGGDTCLPPPVAPDCPAPAVTVLDEPQLTEDFLFWDLDGPDPAVLVFDRTGSLAARDDEPAPGTSTYSVAWPGDCPCSAIAIAEHGSDFPHHYVGSGSPLVVMNGLVPPED